MYHIFISSADNFNVDIKMEPSLEGAIEYADFVYSGFKGTIAKCEVWKAGHCYYSTDPEVQQIL